MKFSFYIFMGICIVLFASLGAWQVQRLEWKNTLQAKLDEALSVQTQQEFAAADIDLLPQQKILKRNMRGIIDFDKRIFWRGHIEGGKPVFYVLAPIEIEGKYLPLILGFSDDEGLLIDPPIPPKSFSIYIRHIQPNVFQPQNNFEKKEIYRFENADLEKFWGKKTVQAAAYLTDKSFSVPPLKPVSIQTKLPNNHLNYAIFWFSMGFLVFALTLFMALQRRFKSV